MKGIGIDTPLFAEVKAYEDLIQESIRRILLTVPDERPMIPNFGVGVRQYLFSNMNRTQDTLYDSIVAQINTYEPRIILETININQIEDKKWQVIIKYRIRENYTAPQEVVVDV